MGSYPRSLLSLALFGEDALSPRFSNLAVDDLHRVCNSVVNSGVELLPVPRLADLNYVDSAAPLIDDAQVVQAALNHLATEVTM